jgi:gliding motility-associated-like protein
MNSSLPSPTTQPGLKAYYTFDNLLNKQGNSTWNGILGGSASINKTTPTCSFTADSCNQVTNGISGIINNYTPVLSFQPCTNVLTVEDGSAFNTGDTVLLIQMKGAVIDSSNTPSFGSITNIKNAGNYEFNYVKSKTGNQIELLNNLTRPYDFIDGKIQLVRVPYFSSVTVNNILTCLPWDGRKGGILVLNVQDNVNLTSTIDVSGKGFKGGQPLFGTNVHCNKTDYFYPPSNNEGGQKGEGISIVSLNKLYGRGNLANGGGGGNSHNAGGAGGGNSGKGGNGGNQYPLALCPVIIPDIGGIGGNSLINSNNLNKAYAGGGGGSGHANDLTDKPGGAGGGIAIIMANSITGNSNSILANGENVIECISQTSDCANDGHSGGGAGGTIFIKVNQITNDTRISAKGGKGADAWIMPGSVFTTGPGGGGGGGLIWYSQASTPSLTTNTVTGGANGVARQYNNDPWGAQPGQPGAILFGLQLPFDNSGFRKNIDSVRIKDSIISCQGFDLKGLAFTNSNPITGWQWYFGDGNSSTTQNNQHIYGSQGSFNVKLVVTDVNGCSDSISRVLVTSAQSNFSINPPGSICIDSSFQLNASGGTFYSWQPTTSLSNPLIPNPIASPAATTTYTVTITDTLCRTTSSLSSTITVLPRPIIKAQKTNDIDCSNYKAQLTAIGGSQYLWSPQASLSNSISSSPVATPKITTTYYVTGKNIAGCISQDSIIVYVTTANKGRYLMPSGFTPNNDGINDCFGIRSWGIIQQLEFSIYNRWGERVFFTKNPSDCWNGKYKGILQDPAVFIYMIKAKTNCEDNLFRKGSFLLIR